MTTVYIVAWIDKTEYGTNIQRVCSSQEAAEAYIKGQPIVDQDYLEFEEWPLES